MGLIFHRGGGPRPPLVRGKTFGEQFLRFMLLLAVFAATGYAFYWNNTRVIEVMGAKSSVYDPGKRLADDERDALLEFVSLFKDEFGMGLKIVIARDDVVLPELDSKTVFVGLNPDTGQILVDLPRLAVGALGQDYAYTLQNAVYPPFHERGQWQKGLLSVLKSLWDSLLAGTPQLPPDRTPLDRKPLNRTPLPPSSPDTTTGVAN